MIWLNDYQSKQHWVPPAILLTSKGWLVQHFQNWTDLVRLSSWNGILWFSFFKLNFPFFFLIRDKVRYFLMNASGRCFKKYIKQFLSKLVMTISNNVIWLKMLFNCMRLPLAVRLQGMKKEQGGKKSWPTDEMSPKSYSLSKYYASTGYMNFNLPEHLF